MVLTYITNFFLTEWIWSITVASLYIITNFVFLCILFKLWDHLSWIRTLVLSTVLSLGAFITFFVLVAGILVWLLHVDYVLPEDASAGNYNILNTSLCLAAIYSVLQSFFLWLISGWKRLDLKKSILCVMCANIMTALLVYKITFNR